MSRKSLFEIAVLHHEPDEDNPRNVDTSFVVEPTHILATNQENATMQARLTAMNEDNLGPEDVDEFNDKYEILVRPFR